MNKICPSLQRHYKLIKDLEIGAITSTDLGQWCLSLIFFREQRLRQSLAYRGFIWGIEQWETEKVIMEKEE